MKILVIGGGGREHALAWKLAQSPATSKLYAAPGNPGIATLAECVPANVTDPDCLLAIAESAGIDLTVVGPEAPLAAGVVDVFRSRGLPIVGPIQSAARLESSKGFAKEVMIQAGVPTARSVTVESVAEAHAAIRRFEFPVVLKADGLAAGKGVVIANTREEAKRTAEAMLAGELVGNAGRRLLVEEFLKGEEVSFIAITDGRTVIPLEATQDHKAIFDGDRGPNTGGMGAYCDGRILPPSATEDVLSTVVLPVVEYMRDKEEPFTGFLYAGLMLTEDGPKVLEFNVRLGDPETQALMMRLNSDLASLLLTCARGALSGIRPGWSTDPSVCVVMAAAGYPGQVRTGDPITGIAEAERDGAVVFHAGTACVNGEVRTAGGRVLGVTASGADLPAAIARTYDAVGRIRFEGAHYRTDIGVKGLKRW